MDQKIKEIAESFFEWPTENKSFVTLTSALLFAEKIAELERERCAKIAEHYRETLGAINPSVPVGMLETGDIIDLKEGMRVYAEVADHFLYANRRGVFDETSRGEIEIAGDLGHFAGNYVVYKTVMDGGDGPGVHDAYPDGHHVFAEKLDDPSVRVDFYQSGVFTAMLPELKAIKGGKYGKSNGF